MASGGGWSTEVNSWKLGQWSKRLKSWKSQFIKISNRKWENRICPVSYWLVLCFLCSCAMTYSYLNIPVLPGGNHLWYYITGFSTYGPLDTHLKTNFKCDHSVESLFFFRVRRWPFLRSLLAAPRNLGCQDPNSAKSVCDLRRCRGRAAGLSIKPGGLTLPECQVWIWSVSQRVK